VSQIRGRFQKDADKLAAEYTASISFDWRLYPYDITGSIAHARMLAKQGIISDQEAEVIEKIVPEYYFKAIQEAKESGKEIHVAEAVPSASIEEIKITYKKEMMIICMETSRA